MEIKKNPKANLEKFKLIFLTVSLILSIGALVSAFEWSSSSASNDFMLDENIEEEEMMEITRQDLQEPEPEQPQEQQQQQTIEIIEIVDNTEDITEDAEFDFEFDEDEEINFEDTEEEEDDQIFVYVKNMPEFPGGQLALRRYIAENIVYPAVARENGIAGTVYLRFEVTRTGTIGKVQLQKGVDPLLDEEAIRVIKGLPKFKPGEQNGKKVNVWYSIPVTFKLN
jgi:protein TonB